MNNLCNYYICIFFLLPYHRHYLSHSPWGPLTSFYHFSSSPFPVQHTDFQLFVASHCRFRRFVFFLVCFILRLHLQLMLKPDIGFVFSSVRILIFFVILSVLIVKHTNLLSDPDICFFSLDPSYAKHTAPHPHLKGVSTLFC